MFTGNKQTCLKILTYQVQKIMGLVAKHTTKAPGFLDLLKRNQAYVMKSFMQYRAEVAQVIDQPLEGR